MGTQRSGVFRSGGAADTLEVVHRIDLDLVPWLEGLYRVIRPLLIWAPGMFAGVLRGVAGRPGLEVACGVGDADLVELTRATAHRAAIADLQVMASHAGRVYTVGSSYAGPTDLHDVINEAGGSDALLIQCFDFDGGSLLSPDKGVFEYLGFSAPSSSPIQLTTDDRDDLDFAAAHLAAAWRLRRRLLGGDAAAPCEAVLTPDGSMSHAEGAARHPLAREALSRAVNAIERARTRERRTDDRALLEAWQAVYEGRWTLVEQIESDGRRLMLARVNEHRRAARPDFSPREQEVAHLLTLGIPQKTIAYELGVAPSTVAFHLHNIMTKLGARSTVDAVRLLLDPAPSTTSGA
jgi:DNA-binding CsgD family transcriptional regulator